MVKSLPSIEKLKRKFLGPKKTPEPEPKIRRHPTILIKTWEGATEEQLADLYRILDEHPAIIGVGQPFAPGATSIDYKLMALTEDGDLRVIQG